MKRILLVNTVDTKKDMETVLPPLGLGYLAGSLRKAFGSDAFDFRVVDRDIESETDEFKPNMVGIISVTQNYNKAKEYAKFMKERNIPVVIGGIHISKLPYTLTENMDVGVVGEGEETIIDLMNTFLKKGGFETGELRKIKGIVFWENDEIVLTGRRNLIENLDDIPIPSRDLFKIEKATYMFTSRGCPYRCVFCASSRFWDRVRLFSAEYVVKEIKHLVEDYGVRRIGFWDDIFVIDRKRLERISDLLEEEGLLGRVSFDCNLRSNLVDKELAIILKRLNVKSVCIGFESASPQILKYLKGNSITIQDHENAIRILREYGIEPNASLVIGSPKETRSDILKTLDFVKRNRLNFAVYVLTPLPGTPIWDYAKSRGLVSDDMDWDLLNISFGDNHKKAIILSETMTREELHKMFMMFRNEKIRRSVMTGLKTPMKIPLKMLRVFRKMVNGESLIPA